MQIDRKQKFDSDSDSETEPDWDPEYDYKKDIAAEIALEIGLRERLLETVESRIAWALLLQETLMNDAPSDAPQVLDFKDVALDALAAADVPAEIIFARDEPTPPQDTRRPSIAKKSRKKPTARPQLAKKSAKFMYIKLEGSTAPSILRCPACLRADFSSLQGLFNHARGTHSLAWTSHDECVRQCACALEELQGGAVEFADLDAGVEVGVGSGGVLPGLRSLFQQAVGGDDEELDLDGETALSRTLGYHVDTPALASFLGREPIRRGVTVWDPDALVDIDGFEDEKLEAKPRWRMPFSHRNIFKDVPLPSSPVSLEVVPFESTPRSNGKHIGLSTASSRFHIVTRIAVVDRSLWIPPDQRLGRDTHKWMISVDAPSYTYHITSVLKSLTVTSSRVSLSTSAPPFAVIGTADAPFLAHLELAFSSTSVGGMRQKIVLEHWVELDRMQGPNVVYGEEQIVDVELDRATLLFPAQRGYLPISTRALWDMDLAKERRTPVVVATALAPTEVPAPGSLKDERKTRNTLPKMKILGTWQNILKKLVERFPLTLQDVKGGKPPSPALPYKLVANTAQFSALVMGRKKAIEWGRAMALRDAYNEAVLGGLTEDVTTLSTADIFAWLHDNNYFPRGVATLKKEQDLETLKTGFCRVCGLAYRLHAVVSDPPQGSVKSEPRPSLALSGVVGDAFVCHITPMDWQMKRMPMIDVSRLLPRRRQGVSPLTSVPFPAPASAQTNGYPESSARNRAWGSRAPALLALSDPRLISSVHRLTSALKLPSFDPPPPPTSGLPHYPISATLSAGEIQADVAPYALLALLTKQFVRALVRTGLDTAARDRHRAMAQVDGRVRRLPNVAELFGDRERRMLTPSHILRGVLSRGWEWNDDLGMAMLGCLSRSGVPLHALQQQPQQQQQGLHTDSSAAAVLPSAAVGTRNGPEIQIKTEPDLNTYRTSVATLPTLGDS
ncbi:hypothetical protein C8R43DRAFT_135738 [Mycena crocata]|nr:hypothetical protein C8R43DRAFT_135738 [Mycena crocata]